MKATTNNTTINTLLSLLFILISIQIHAKKDNLTRLRITPIKDLPSSEINDICQDSFGFTYFATLDGLYRYDGVNMKSYLFDPNSQNSISTNMILNIVEDKNGYLWLGTYGRGVCRLNPKRDSITNFKISTLTNLGPETDNSETIFVDKDNNVIVGNRMGVYQLKLDKNSNLIKTTTLYSQPENTYTLNRNNNIKEIYQSKNGDMWYGYSDSLYHIHYNNKGDKEIRRYRIDKIQSITEDDSGLYTGGESIMHIPYNKELNIYSKDAITIYDKKATYISKINNHLLIGSREGVYCISQNNNKEWKLDYNINKENAPFNLKSDVVSCVYPVTDSQIWVSTRGGGAYLIMPKSKMFKNVSESFSDNNLELTRSIFQDSQNQLWIGTEQNGLIYYGDQTQPLYKDYKKIDIGTTYENRAYSIEETIHNNKNIIWIGTTSPVSLVRVNAKTKEKIPQKNSIYPELGNVFAIKKSDNNTLWIGTYNNGLWRLTINNNGNILGYHQFNTLNSNISSNIIRNISLDSKNNLWIGTDMGINRIKSSQLHDSIIHFNHNIDKQGKFNTSDYYILQITESSTGNILISTMGNGFIIYDPIRDSIKQITKKENLANNSVKTIVEDKNTGKLWISTNMGLASYNPKTDSLINYRDANLLNTLEFSEYCGLMSYNGNIIFGSNIGLTLFKPEEIYKDHSKPKSYLRNLYINDQKIDVGESYNGNTVMHTAPEYVKDISLCYDNRNISFEFSGIHYISSNLIQFSYYLEGFDKDWSTPNSSLRRATYTNLKEGDYIFRLRTANSDEIWSDDELSINLHIAPPFYRSILAYIIYAILIAVIILVIIYVQRTIYLKKVEVTKLSLEKEKNEEITQSRLRFFTNISHEFRTPLTLISISLESIDKRAHERGSANDIEDSNIIHCNTNILRNLIDEQIEFRKIENGKIIYKPKLLEVNRYIEQFYNHFKPLAKNKNINLSYSQYKDEIFANIDNRQMQKVMFNLVSNSFRHTTINSNITLSVSVIDSKINIKICDNGNGIAAENMPFIFDRYYQARNNNLGQEEGSGIGLALCREIMILHGGNIKIESKEGEGTTATLILDILPKGETINSEYTLDKKYAARYEWINNKFENNTIVENINNQAHTSLNLIDLELGEDDSIQVQLPKLLIVDDNITLLNKLNEVFKESYTVYVAKDGLDGLELAKTQWPDIILLDLMMPNMNGIEMCKALKNSKETSHIPIIIMTANGSEENQLDSYKIAKADAYIEKPFNIKVLSTQISNILENRQLGIDKFQKSIIVNIEELDTTASDKKFLQDIINIMKQNMENSELTIENIANDYGISRVYLNRKIKALTNLTSNQLLRDLRLKKAAILLKERKLNVNEVAWKVGYNDLRTFRTRFKEVFGTTPSSYANTNSNSTNR